MLRRRSLASLSLSRFKMAVLPRQQRNGKGGVKTFHRRLRLFLCSKIEDSHHQFGLQPFPNVVVYAEIDVPALVVQLPHGEAGYVAAKMLQDVLFRGNERHRDCEVVQYIEKHDTVQADKLF